MKKRILIALLGVILCVALSFGIETLLPHTFTQPLNEVPGVVMDGEDDDPIFRLEGWDQQGEEDYSEEEYSEDEEYDEDEYSEDEYYEDEYAEEDYSEEEYEEPVYQILLSLKDTASQVLLTSSGNQECEVLVITDEGETDYYIEDMGSYQLNIPVSGQESVTVRFSDSQRILQKIRILEEGGFNGCRMLMIALLLTAVFLLWFLRDVIGEHLEYGFLITAAALLILFAVLMPNINSLWWDGDIHYRKAYELGTLFEMPAAGKRLNEWLVDQDMSILNYVFSGLAVFAGRILNLPSEACLFLERAVSSLGYLFVCFLAIRWAKRGKRSLTVIALLPVSLFMAVSYSYDTTIASFALLGIALIVNELCTPNEKLSAKNAMLITFAIVMSGLAKAVYMPVLLLMLLLPRTKFESKKQHIAYKAGVVAVFAAVMIAFVLPMIAKPEVYFDSRGAGESSTSQIGYILSNIPSFAGMLITSVWNDLYSNILLSSRTFLAYIGGASSLVQVVTLMFMLYVFVTDNDPHAQAEQLKAWHKICFAVIFLGITALIYTVFYITFTETGASVVNGVQGRYFLPIFPLLAAAIQPKGIENRMNKKHDHFVILVFNLLTTAVIIYDLILSVYYL